MDDKQFEEEVAPSASTRLVQLVFDPDHTKENFEDMLWFDKETQY